MDQELFPYNHDKSKIMVLPVEPSLVRCNTSSVEVREKGRL